MRQFLLLAAVGLLLAPDSSRAVFGAGDGVPPPAPIDAAPTRAARVDAGLRATRFVPNVGQWCEEVRGVVLGETVGWIHDDGFTLRYERASARPPVQAPDAMHAPVRSGAVLRTRFAGRARRVEPCAEMAARQHFLIGDDAARHRSDVPAYARMRLVEVLPGIDVILGPLRDAGPGPFAYDLELAPGADLDAFVVRCEGASALRIDAAGELCVTLPTPTGPVELRHSAPIAWQAGADGRTPLPVQFRLLGPDRYGFVAAGRDPAQATTIDPGVVWSTYLGGGATDSVNDLVWKPGVGIWVGGWAGSLDFPTTVGAYQVTGGSDGFVARLSEDGSQIVYATYFGGSGNEEVRGIDLGPGNTPTLAGFTHSVDLPVTAGAVQPAYAGASLVLDLGDAFVARLSANGGQLLGSTYLGGAFDETAEDVAVDNAGNAYLAGWTSSGNFPTTPGVWRPALGGPLTLQTDGFVTCVAADCRSLVYSTYAGGSLPDQLRSIDIDRATNEVVAAGWSVSADFPTTPSSYRTTSAGLIDLVALRLRADGTLPVFSTYLGGSDTDVAESVHLAADGSVWVGGFTRSANFPTTLGAPQRQPGGDDDGLIVRFAANGQSMLYSTLFGGAGADVVRGIDQDGSDLLVVGQTTGNLSVTANATQPNYGGGGLDAFVAHFDNSGGSLAYASYFGGAAQDVLSRARIDTGLCVLGGWSFSADHPVTPGALQPQLLGAEDGVLMQLDLLTDLGDGLQIQSLSPPATLRRVGAGRAELLAVRARNLTGRELLLDGVRVLVAGSGDGPSHLHQVRVYVDDPVTEDPFDDLVGGPVPIQQDDAELNVPLAGVSVPRLGETLLRITVDVTPPGDGSTIEGAAATVSADAWDVRAYGQGAGPTVRVFGDGRSDGAVLIVGALPGDADGDGLRTVFDLRRQCVSLGAASTASDCDGDGLNTVRDVELTQDAVLGRAAILSTPGQVQRGQWFTLRGVFPIGGIVDATLGGRSLRPGTLTPREATFFVDASQAVGLQSLQVAFGGELVLVQDVSVP